jgi:hypothetical protein
LYILWTVEIGLLQQESNSGWIFTNLDSWAGRITIS